MCECKYTETILALIIIVFAVFVDAVWSKWVVLVAAIILMIHALACKKCDISRAGASRPSRKKKR